MLDSLRSLAKTWIGKILGAFLLVGLAGFGISNVIFSFGSSTVATVAGADISVRDYQRAYDTQLNALAQQIGKIPTHEEALAFGVPSMVLNRLASEAAVNKFGEDLGLGVSEARLGKMLREDPSFQSALGTFDRDNFLRVLQASGYTEAEYFDLQTKAARRQQLAAGLFAGSPVPAAAVDLINRYSGDTRSVDYFVLNAQALPPVADPTEDELKAYLTEHQAEFRTKETRTIDLLALTPEAIAATKSIDEAAITAEYERTKESRTRPERRTIQQIALTTPELEKAFTDAQAANTPIGEVLSATGATPQDLGTLARSDVQDPTLAEAAFGLPLNGFTIIEGIGSKRAITVTAIEPGGAPALDEVREEIRKQLALTQARNEYTDILDQVEELRAAFRPLPEIAERFDLQTVNVALTPGGPELASNPDLPVEDAGRISTAVFAATQGELSPTVQLSSTRNVYFDLKQVDPARDQTLDEVRDTVVAAWTDEKTAEALTVEVTRLTDQLKAGTPFADVAASINQFPILSPPLKRSGDGTTVLNQTVAAAIFDGGPEHFGSAVNGDGDHVVFQVVEVIPAPADAAAQARQFVENSTRDALYADFVNGLKDAAGLRINTQVLNQLLDTGATQ